ncbi:hypothetical protein HZA44_03230 [Candidatus Peregrinibacteria bacterium]|nr:hypothetical protein [Candidatus Peregrinibacteria bacterium]
MATNETPKVIHLGPGPEETPKNEAINLVNETRMNLQLSTAKEEVCVDSKIDAPRTFSEAEIIDAVLGTLTEKQKLNLEALKVTRIIRDHNKTVVVLEAESPDADGKGGYTEIKYIIQGKHKTNSGQNASSATTVIHTYFDSDGMPESGDTVAEFKDGEWVNTPKA